MEGPAYLILDRDGAPLGLTRNLGDAMDIAYDLEPAGHVYLDAPTEDDYALIAAADAAEEEESRLAANPEDPYEPSTHLRQHLQGAPGSRILNAPAQSRRALSAAGVKKIDFDRAKNMSLVDAHRALVDFFPTTKYEKKTGLRKAVRQYTKPRGTHAHKGMAFAFLGQNYKTAKTTPQSIVSKLYAATKRRSASVLGLSLLPTTQSYASSAVEGIMERAPDLYGVRDVRKVRLNACVRATAECASSCLAFSGHNLIDDYNTVKKYALTESFVHEPEAFIRMLAENIAIHRQTSLNSNVMPLVRLNVFSDLPWEKAVPGLFKEFHDVQFYDYTKVPNREPPRNYDLTFSFAGTAGNVAAMDYEIRERGRRVAVVFAATSFKTTPSGQIEMPKTPEIYRRKPGAKRKTAYYAKLPEEFLGLEVIDGDVSDMRPYDPAPSIVGLRWKNPRGQNVTAEKANVFIVRVDVVPRAGGYADAIVSKTARYDDVDYSKYAPSNVDE